MRNRNLLTIFVGMAFTLFITSQALAQAPIEGWDKAKFGMSPKELKEAYKEEEQYFPRFWVEVDKDDISGFNPSPYILTTLMLTVLGKRLFVDYKFVDDKLFEIEISLLAWGPVLIGIEFEEQETSSSDKILKKAINFEMEAKKIEDHVLRKYGNDFEKRELPFEEKEAPGKSRRSKIENLIWKDTKDNSIVFKKTYRYAFYKGIDYYLLEYCTITYFDGELRKLWEEKQRRLGKIALESF